MFSLRIPLDQEVAPRFINFSSYRRESHGLCSLFIPKDESGDAQLPKVVDREIEIKFTCSTLRIRGKTFVVVNIEVMAYEVFKERKLGTVLF